MAQITGPGPSELKLLAIRLREAPPALRRDLRANFRDIGGPVVGAVQASILAMPSHHDGTLRREIARTVSSSVGITRNGVRLDIVSSGRKMPPGKDRLPAYADSARGWSHPVWGNRKVWVRQHGKTAWFEGPAAKAGRPARAACQSAMDETKRRLGG